MSDSIWTKAFPVTVQGVTREIPATNFAGRNYLTPVDPVMERQAEIKARHRVLDVGGGDHPFARADVVTEPYLEDTTHRGGRRVQSDKKYVQCFAERMPFDDDEFDYAISRHVLEHVEDPEAACREISRVAKRGFIETPGAWHELFYGFAVHRWLICIEDGILVFRPKPFMRSPYLNCLLWMVYHDLDFIFRWEYQFRNLTSVQFPWEGEIKCRVESQSIGALDYNNDDQVAEAQLAMVQDGLAFGGIPAGPLLNELQTALKHKPNYPEGLNALGVIQAREKAVEEAQRSFRKARELAPEDEFHKKNTRILLPVEAPELKLLPPEPWDAEDPPRENFAGLRYDTVSDESDAVLPQELGIDKGERVLDIISGVDPLERADETLDLNTEVFIGSLPYDDGAFDWVLCRMALQSVEDPESLCREIQRVGKKGFIEVPRFFWEYVYGRPCNRWLCKKEGDALVFRRKRFARIPFKSVLLNLLSIHPALLHRFEYAFRNVAYIQTPWTGSFEFRVEDDPDSPFDYGRPEHRSLAHTDYLMNLCNLGAPELGLPDAEAILVKNPDDPLGHSLLGIILIQLGRAEEGIQRLRRAAELAPEDPMIVENYRTFAGEMQKAKIEPAPYDWLPEI